MLCRSVCAVILLLGWTAQAIREQANGAEIHAVELHQRSNTSGCTDYCVKCADGTAVWYGRSRDWDKFHKNAAGATVVAGAAAIATVTMGLPVIAGAGVALVSAPALSSVTTNENDVFTHTHWSAHIPTTGLMCERHDVIKFTWLKQWETLELEQSGSDGEWKHWETSLMKTSHKSYDASSRANLLKPYDLDPDTTKPGFEESDLDNYKEGCKVVKGGGVRAFKQFMPGAVPKAITMCSLHSKLCGIDGNPEIVKASTSDECLQHLSEKPAS